MSVHCVPSTQVDLAALGTLPADLLEEYTQNASAALAALQAKAAKQKSADAGVVDAKAGVRTASRVRDEL